MIKNFSKLVSLVEKNTTLDRESSCAYLLQTEDIIRQREIAKHGNFNKEYFLNATPYVIQEHKNELYIKRLLNKEVKVNDYKKI